MGDPQVFISHSSHQADARDARLTLESALRNAGLGVLVDERELKLGDQWRRRIFTMISECHAAVVMLSEDALTSPHVFLEIAWLMGRRYRDESFRIIPVLLPPVTRADLDRDQLRAMNLKELQQGNMSDGLLKQVIGLLTPLKAAFAPSPLDELLDLIAVWLPARDDRVAYIAARLNIGIQDLSPDLARRQIARELLGADLASLPGIFQVLAPNLGSRTEAESLLAVLACTWVDPEAAAPILAAMRPGENHAVALNGNEDVTALAYLQRACARFPCWPTLKTLNKAGPDQYGRLLRDIRKAYKARFPNKKFKDNEEIDKQLGLDPGDSPNIAIIPGMIGSDVLRRLRSHYQHLGYFVLTRDEEPATVLSELAGATVLEPPLEAAREREFLERYQQAQNKIVTSLP